MRRPASDSTFIAGPNCSFGAMAQRRLLFCFVFFYCLPVCFFSFVLFAFLFVVVVVSLRICVKNYMRHFFN